MNRSDVLLVLGASFSNHTGITTKRKLIQIDFERMMLGKFHEVDLPMWGEIGTTLELLTERLTGRAPLARFAGMSLARGRKDGNMCPDCGPTGVRRKRREQARLVHQAVYLMRASSTN